MATPLRREFVVAGAGAVGIKKEEEEGGVGGDMVGDEGKGPINQLVLSYLSHHGYAKTARAFQAQCERRGGLGVGGSRIGSGVVAIPVLEPVPQVHDDIDVDMDMDLSSPSKPPSTLLPPSTSTPTFDGCGPGMHHTDIELRTRIVNSVISGDIDTALQETARWHPKVLEREEGLMLFKLRCRKFVELILEAAELKKRMRGGEGGAGGGVGGGGGEEGWVDGMDIDDSGIDERDGDDGVMTNGFGSSTSSAIPIKAKRKQSRASGSDWFPSSSTSASAAAAQYESALTSAITYGQTLQSDYKTDSRPEVRAIFNRTFGVVAYEDPLEAGGEAAEVAGHEARILLATELNQDILRECLPLVCQLYSLSLLII
jgi:hypothetical protein